MNNEHVEPTFDRLATEQELLAARTKAQDFEKENCDLVHTLTLKEQELDLRSQEKVKLTIPTLTSYQWLIIDPSSNISST